jgi:hypothetical protein
MQGTAGKPAAEHSIDRANAERQRLPLVLSAPLKAKKIRWNLRLLAD